MSQFRQEINMQFSQQIILQQQAPDVQNLFARYLFEAS